MKKMKTRDGGKEKAHGIAMKKRAQSNKKKKASKNKEKKGTKRKKKTRATIKKRAKSKKKKNACNSNVKTRTITINITRAITIKKRGGEKRGVEEKRNVGGGIAINRGKHDIGAEKSAIERTQSGGEEKHGTG